MDGTSWEETTSLVVLKSDETPERLAGFIAANSDFSSKKDTLLVVNTSKNTFSTKGVIEDREMPKSLFGHSSFLDQLLR